MAPMHQVLYGKKPTKLQRRLYLNPHQFRGFSNDEKDPERFAAVFAMALLHARDTKEPVTLIMPQAYIAWAFEQMKVLIRKAFQNVGKEGKEELKKAVYHLNLCPGPQAFRQAEPKNWMMFGHQGGPRALPEWTKGRLLDEDPS